MDGEGNLQLTLIQGGGNENEKEGNIKYMEFMAALTLFTSLYCQNYPRQLLSVLQHHWECLTFMDEGKDILDIIAYDSLVRAHYVAGEGRQWVIHNHDVHLKSVGIGTRKSYKEAQIQEKLYRNQKGGPTAVYTKHKSPQQNSNSAYTKGAKAPYKGGQKGKGRMSPQQAGCCFGYNSSKGCEETAADCKFKHKCTKCYADHVSHTCDGSGPGLPMKQG